MRSKKPDGFRSLVLKCLLALVPFICRSLARPGHKIMKVTARSGVLRTHSKQKQLRIRHCFILCHKLRTFANMATPTGRLPARTQCSRQARSSSTQRHSSSIEHPSLLRNAVHPASQLFSYLNPGRRGAAIITEPVRLAFHRRINTLYPLGESV